MKNPGMNCFTNLALGFFIFQNSVQAAVKSTFANSSERRIPATLSAILCQRQAVDSDFISHGVFDAQIEITTLRPKDSSSKITAKIAQKRARELAQASEQLGYASGICDDGSAWVGTFPGPAGIELSGSELRLPMAAKSICANNSLKVLFAAERRGRSMSVPFSEDLVARIPAQKGFVSVSCVPKIFSDSGPREWALFPTESSRYNVPELRPSLNESSEESLIKWINARRQGDSLPPLAMDKDLEAASKVLAVQTSVRHNLPALSRVRNDLAKLNVQPLGEDRANGKTIGEIAGLLWRSPGHRDLLLNPSGQIAGITVSKNIDGSLMAVVLIGQRSSGRNVAKYIK